MRQELLSILMYVFLTYHFKKKKSGRKKNVMICFWYWTLSYQEWGTLLDKIYFPKADWMTGFSLEFRLGWKIFQHHWFLEFLALESNLNFSSLVFVFFGGKTWFLLVTIEDWDSVGIYIQGNKGTSLYLCWKWWMRLLQRREDFKRWILLERRLRQSH